MVVLEGRRTFQTLLPVVLGASEDLALSIFGSESGLTFAVALKIILTPFFCWLAFSLEEVELICTLRALRLVVDEVVAETVGIFGVTVSPCQQVAILALSTSVTVVPSAELNGADVIGEAERGDAVQAPLLAIFLTPIDLALSIDCQLERSPTLDTILVAVVLQTSEDDFNASIIAPLIPLSTTGALIISFRDTTFVG